MAENKNILSKEGYLIRKKYCKDIDKIKEELTVAPHIVFAVNKNIKPESFPVYLENEKYLCVPKYYGLDKFGSPSKNKEIIGETVSINFKGSLRDDQKEVMDVVLPKLEMEDGGLLCLRPGFGKTTLSLYIASIFKVKTLVIVHKSFLLNQWKKRAEQFTDASVGIIQQNKVDTDGKQIVIGMLQSIAKDKYETDIFRDFGLVIFDEAHHAPSKYFSRALPIIACKKTLSLTATPKRQDKLEKVLYWYFGPILYTIPSEKTNTLLVKTFKYNIKHDKFKEYFLPHSNNSRPMVNRSKTINKLVEIDKRNIFIVDQIKELLEEAGRKIIVLSDRVEHLTVLKEMLDKFELATTSFYIGGMKQSKLDESENAQVIFGTFSMASEALDIPDLNTLVMATARKEIEQTVGRILRKQHEVQPIVVDIVDQLPSFSRQGMQRRKFYKTNNYVIKIYEVEENEIISVIDEVEIAKPKKIIQQNIDNDEFLD
jgi:superfamily II DNA or RNA helicase